MVEEHNSIMKNDVWEIVLRPKGKPMVDFEWLYKLKHTAEGNIEKYEACFVARGFSHKNRGDCEETLAPIVRYTSIKTIMSLASMFDWKLYHIDVKTAFLNGVIVHGHDKHVCRLKQIPLWAKASTTCLVL